MQPFSFFTDTMECERERKPLIRLDYLTQRYMKKKHNRKWQTSEENRDIYETKL